MDGEGEVDGLLLILWNIEVNDEGEVDGDLDGDGLVNGNILDGEGEGLDKNVLVVDGFNDVEGLPNFKPVDVSLDDKEEITADEGIENADIDFIKLGLAEKNPSNLNPVASVTPLNLISAAFRNGSSIDFSSTPL